MTDPREFATPDDSVWCNLCDPPHETSVAMLNTHLVTVHGIDPEDIAGAEVVDGTEEESTSSEYDSRPETQAHIDRVREFLDRAVVNLEDRSNVHDASKLVPPELEAFDIATPKLAGLEYGSEEYKQSLHDLGPALQHHFAMNDHHPEHYENGCRGMSLMALIEMLCDWRAASERVKQRLDDPDKVKTFDAGLAYNQQRFGYSDELAEILLNTARELGMLDVPTQPEGE